MKWGLVALLLGQLITLNDAAFADTTNALTISPSRNFGYNIGDVLQQSISLQHEGQTHTIEQLPVTQREGRWVTRTTALTSRDGKWLELQYQIINAPPTLRFVELPAMSLETAQGLNIKVAAWSFSLAPLIPTRESSDSKDQMTIMQSDWRPQSHSTSGARLRIKQLGAALLATLLCWLSWWAWRNRRESSRLPFAGAYNYIRKHPPGSGPENNDAWFALHRAFDTAAGRSVDSASIDKLIARTPWLKPFSTDLHTFFSLSSRRFFSPGGSDETLDLPKLAKRLFKAERQHTKSVAKNSARIKGLP